ncbi:MAG TPA: peptidylprolyl isomerase [Blastocatellia bacterium]|nr:peptidylprolyl isomerase [Blastocatellia bacterium]
MTTRRKIFSRITASRHASLALLALSLVWVAACDNKTPTTNTANANANQSATPANANQSNANQPQPSPSPANPNQKNPVAVIETSAGNIKIELLADLAPVTAENFRQLADRGYYNGTIFHRTISGFMIQGGDPTGTGMGGETATGRPLPNEIRVSSPYYQGGYKRGLVAMANKGRPETGSSQFFIMHQNYPLQPNYTIFGRVIDGLPVVDKIATARTGAQDRPVSPVRMTKVYIEK